MLRTAGQAAGERASALWGNGRTRGGGPRSSAGRSPWKRGLGAVLATVLALAAAPLAATAGNGNGSSAQGASAYVEPTLLQAAQSSPSQKFHVIVQGAHGMQALESAVGNGGGLIRRQLQIVQGVAADVTGGHLLALAKSSDISRITLDAPAHVAGIGNTPYTSGQIWPFVSGNAALWGSLQNPAPQAPTIAIVDSGIDASRPDFGSRVIAQVDLASGTSSAADDRGHGTFVAGIAAGSAPGYAGAAPNADLVSVKVMGSDGSGLTSDVIAGAQWVLQNAAAYGIRVANFSLHSGMPSHFVNDPLDQAVEKLWFNGIVVVAAAGNYGTGSGPSGVKYAPGNDPFVITAGAADLNASPGTGNDFAAPWSAYGSTYDGFWKPELGAPGRYMVGPIPPASTLAAERASSIVAPGYIQLSGTSFAAPAIAGAAANVLALHPGWTPDQVKGALMLTARPVPSTPQGSLGVGEIDAVKAAGVADPPNPNAGLDAYLVTDPSGASGPVFDGASWESTVASDASWTDASWTDASWTDASWSTASWTDASWTDASWTDASWTDASWATMAQTDASWEDAAAADTNTAGAYTIDDTATAAILADPTMAPPGATAVDGTTSTSP